MANKLSGLTNTIPIVCNSGLSGLQIMFSFGTDKEPLEPQKTQVFSQAK